METVLLLMLFFSVIFGFGTIGELLLKLFRKLKHQSKAFHNKNYFDSFL